MGLLGIVILMIASKTIVGDLIQRKVLSRIPGSTLLTPQLSEDFESGQFDSLTVFLIHIKNKGKSKC